MSTHTPVHVCVVPTRVCTHVVLCFVCSPVYVCTCVHVGACARIGGFRLHWAVTPAKDKKRNHQRFDLHHHHLPEDF